jgi:hypothetical protein
MQIHHVLTADDPFGCPWPPNNGDGAVWAVVRRMRGFTLWRSITVSAAAAVAGTNSFLAAKGKNHE